MILTTAEEAQKKYCPFQFNKDEINYCTPDTCMAWVEVENCVIRENHSGAYEAMLPLALKRNVTIRKEGVGCTGYYIIDARGYCARLQHGD